MTHALTRTHVIAPTNLIKDVDRIAGHRNRSKFFVTAAAEKVRQLKLIEAVKKLGGSLKNTEVSGWEAPENASRWVHNLRVEADQKRNI